ncbi:DUF2255 family protein [Streptomyces sp. NPDC026672]|uniref:DUF2255 family protein n=1 Tax=unclassified Streptomyces TaxID=2593676 RepID=UPI00340E1BC5
MAPSTRPDPRSHGDRSDGAAMSAVRTRPWTVEELAALDTAFSLVLAARTDDGPPRGSVEIGVVVTPDGVFVRAHRGPVSGWFRATLARGLGTVRFGGRTVGVRFDRASPSDEPGVHDAIDEAYARKYGSLSGGIASERARAATVRLTPAAG